MSTTQSREQPEPVSPTPPPGAAEAAPPPPAIPPDLRSFLTSLIASQCSLIGASAGVVYLLASEARSAGIVVQHVELNNVGPRGPLALHPPLLERLNRIAEETVASGARPAVHSIALNRSGGLYETEAVLPHFGADRPSND